jgi:plastocyanin
MRRIVTLLLPLAAVAVVAAGCGSSNDNTTSAAASASTPAATTSAPATTTPSTTPSSTTSTGTSTGAAGSVTIKMQNTSFNPAQTTVKVGQKVEWENEDPFDHNVVATAGETFKSDNFGQGGKFEFTVNKPGTIKYVCTIHPGMDGTLTVTG